MLRALRLKSPAMLFSLIFLALCWVSIAPLSASANYVTLDYDNIFSSSGGGINYVPTDNWLTANFKDIGTNEVQLTISTSGFASGVYLGSNGLYFNFNPNSIASRVVFTYEGSSGTGHGVAASSILKAKEGSKSIKAGGGGYYNFELKWGATSAKELSGDETVVYDLTASGLKASDFDYQSTGGKSDFYSAAYLQQRCHGGDWVNPSTPTTSGSPTPIPETLFLFGPALACLVAFRKKLIV